MDSTITQGITPSRVELPVIGERVGRFAILEQLGAGGMGAVFLASDPTLARRVALKVVTPGRSPDGLLEEARALARLQHPNVVAVHEVGHWQGQIYIAMEHVAGAPLDRWLADHTDWRERLVAFRQAAAGLAAAHRAGIVHRDVKPSNIMVGDDGRVRLIDFGLARSDALAGSRDGTPRYMAPEQLRGGATDARSDQFAFCIALYEALFGKYPFESHRADDRGDRGPPCYPVVGPVSNATRAAVLRGLATEPELRHPSMDALIRALDPPQPRVWRFALFAVAGLALIGGAAALDHERSEVEKPPAGKWDAILASSSLPPEQLEPLPDDPGQVTVHRLRNGLTVYISPNHDVPRIHAIWRFHAGAADAPGVAVLAMMMTLRGTERIGTTDYASEKPLLDRIRMLYAQRTTADASALAQIDRDIEAASTAAAKFEITDEHSKVLQAFGKSFDRETVSADQVQFEMDFPSNHFKAWAELEADRWLHPVLRMFRSLVAETLHSDMFAQGSEDTVGEAVYPLLAGEQMVSAAVANERRVIAREPYAEVEEFIARRFVPNNADLILAGDIDAVDAIPVLESALAGWEPRPLPPHVTFPQTPLAAPKTVAVTTATGGRSVSYHWRVSDVLYDDPAFGVLDALLMRLFSDAHVDGFDEWNLFGFSVWVMARPSQTRDDIARALDATIERVRSGQFADDVFAAAVRSSSIFDVRGTWNNTTRAKRICNTRGHASPLVWRDEVARLRATPHVTRADVTRIAHAIFDAPHVTALAEPGTAQPDPVEVPNVPPAKPATTPSKAFKELVERDVVPVQPKFLVAGTDFEERETPAGHVVARRDPKTALFRLVVQFGVGRADLPFVCEALAARIAGAARQRWLDLGIYREPSIDCRDETLGVSAIALDADLPRAIDAFVATLADPTPDEWAREMEKRDDMLAGLATRTDWLRAALGDFALHGANAPSLVELDRRRLRATSDRVAVRALTLLRESPRWIGYYGPRSVDDVVALLPPRDPGPGVEHRPLRLQRGSPRVILVNTHTTKLSPSAHASVWFGIDAPYDRDARLELFEQYWNSDAHPLSDELRGAAHWQIDLDYPDSPRDDGAIELRFDATSEEIASVVERALSEVLDGNPDPGRIEQAKRERGEYLRSDWIARGDVAASVIRFLLRGAHDDPRPGLFARFAHLKQSDFDIERTEIRSAPRTITIWGDLARIDRARLAKLGTITELSVDQLVPP